MHLSGEESVNLKITEENFDENYELKNIII